MYLWGLAFGMFGCGDKPDNPEDRQTGSSAALKELSGTCPTINDSQDLQTFTVQIKNVKCVLWFLRIQVKI